MKKITIMLSALCLAAGLPSTVKAQAPELTLDATTPDMSENEPRPVFPVPSARQLKWNQTARTAIAQIQEKKYPESIESYTGDILLVGINYDKKTKEHQCLIEKYEK